MDINQLKVSQPNQASAPNNSDTNSHNKSDANAFDRHLSSSIKRSESSAVSKKSENNSINQPPVNEGEEDCTCITMDEINHNANDYMEYDQAELLTEEELLADLLRENNVDTDGQIISTVEDADQDLPLNGKDLPFTDRLNQSVMSVVDDVDARNLQSSMIANMSVETEEKSVINQGNDRRGITGTEADRRLVMKTVSSVDMAEFEEVGPDKLAKNSMAIDREILSIQEKQIFKSVDLPASGDDIFPKLSVSSSIRSLVRSADSIAGMTTLTASVLAPGSIVGDPALSPSAQLFKGSIPVPVNTPQWSQALSDHVSMMMKGGFQTAEMKLNPASLGPVEIKMSITDDQAKIQFISAHAQVREAIDQSLPKLREMFEQQGIDLVDVDISQYSESDDDKERNSKPDDPVSEKDIDNNGVDQSAMNKVISNSPSSMINIYA